MAKYYILEKDNQPSKEKYSALQLKLIKKISPDDWVYPDDSINEQWVRAGDIEELFPKPDDGTVHATLETPASPETSTTSASENLETSATPASVILDTILKILEEIKSVIRHFIIWLEHFGRNFQGNRRNLLVGTAGILTLIGTCTYCDYHEREIIRTRNVIKKDSIRRVQASRDSILDFIKKDNERRKIIQDSIDYNSPDKKMERFKDTLQINTNEINRLKYEIQGLTLEHGKFVGREGYFTEARKDLKRAQRAIVISKSQKELKDNKILKAQNKIDSLESVDKYNLNKSKIARSKIDSLQRESEILENKIRELESQIENKNQQN